ncbi:hypothetical protein PR002_g7000 [Phytophthora rubi]|uniref:Uncharacterized protein n=1 Tax=Phytophthora rubi TaxID=129364 RepID=A0A6A3MTX3_9STRA|nr:hypothetical protein PR002_g7000 [Phytophthora rubi]
MPPKQRKPPKGRPRLPGGAGRRVKLNAVNAYTAAHKLKVLQHLSRTSSMAGTIAKFYPELPDQQYNGRRVLIYSWRWSLHKIVAACTVPSEAKKKKASGQGVATVLPTSVELQLVRWVGDLRDEGVPVTTPP